ncbi:TetR/AcrR family transcriptional regulator [Ktedonobacter sp. SOSP1-52]|uniref:TetR/AcrR family transcriptional regulator n=1 Tax=Ktedonobacter sp. SOSP1-52 TaxID=2778366 RepID=UPI0019154EA6|nr:TetR/AcrR family transcriptional regulator [Ktedonobacter sp. SOSP1-52]
MNNTPGNFARKSAQERREDILAAAITEFSEKGFHGGSTVTIAKLVGISQPNLFRLFPTKKALFMSTIERVALRVQQKMIVIGQQHPENSLSAMKRAYRNVLADRELVLLLLQGYAASEDQEIRETMRRSTSEIFKQIAEMPGISREQARTFYADGMLLTIATAMKLSEIADDEEWAHLFLS